MTTLVMTVEPFPLSPSWRITKQPLGFAIQGKLFTRLLSGRRGDFNEEGGFFFIAIADRSCSCEMVGSRKLELAGLEAFRQFPGD